MKKNLLYPLFLVALVVAASYWWHRTPAFSNACLLSEKDVVICAASNMARYGRDDPIVLEHADFDIGARAHESDATPEARHAGTIKLTAARNETVAFQLIFRTIGKQVPASAELTLGDWTPVESTHQAPSLHPTTIQSRLYQAHYHWVDKGGYTWGPKSDVRDWPAAYPDALIPEKHGCLGQSTTLFDSVAIPAKPHTNQAVWFDNFVPRDMPPATYRMPLSIALAEQTIELRVDLTVFDVSLPDKPSIDAIGEVYRSYALEGVGTDRSSPAWQRMAQCYQQLAHEHRMVFIERTPAIPDAAGWQDYIHTYQAQFSGDLFTQQYSYSGTGEGTPVAIWRTPWPQEYNVELTSPLNVKDFLRYAKLSRQWKTLVTQNHWNRTQFFAYVFDEVDGPAKKKTRVDERRAYLSMVHDQMGLLQQTLDDGLPTDASWRSDSDSDSDSSSGSGSVSGSNSLYNSGAGVSVGVAARNSASMSADTDVGIQNTATRLDLLWTSHSNPADWQGDPALDLSGKIRLWSPNASAADPVFLQQRIAAGDTAWFYHSGHPAVGAHSINASGIDMRTWGVIGARYGLSGQFMWAVNLGSDERPFAEPSYKPDDDRFGNGVLLYPGNQLDKIGFTITPGPLPSMRMKTWRRGLQDAEIYFAARKKDPTAADDLIRAMVPTALAEGQGKASWSQQPSAWIEFKKRLLSIASESE